MCSPVMGFLHACAYPKLKELVCLDMPHPLTVMSTGGCQLIQYYKALHGS